MNLFSLLVILLSWTIFNEHSFFELSCTQTLKYADEANLPSQEFREGMKMTPLHSPASGGNVSSSTGNARTPPPNPNHIHSANRSRKNANAKKQVTSPNRQTHNNNYAAPHTPIASAKRPASAKKSASKSVQSAGRRSIGKHNNNSSSSSHGLKDIREEQEVEGRVEGRNPSVSSPMTTPIRKIALDDDVASPTPINAATARVAQMSPMHPARPITHRDDHTATNTLNPETDENDQNGYDDVQANGTCNGGTGGVLSSIFSPVLNFLHAANEDDQDVGDVNAKDTTGGKNAVNATTAHVETETFSDSQDADRVNTSNCEVDDERHHYGQYRERSATEETDATTSRTATNTNANATRGYYPQDDNEYDNDGDITMRDDDDGYGQHYHHEEDNNDDGVDDDDDDEDEEFNPYLFIKYLPSYHSVVPFPEHKICLPPKDPTGPPISLVLDLDETLVHCTVEPIPDADMTFPVFFNGIQYKVHVRTRPFLKEFLEKVRGRFEVVVFTASQEVYASELLNRIDPGE